jgi:FtsP/CotA-like multicopper oxidase with cupredoxin domain
VDLSRLFRVLPALLAAGAVALLTAGVVTVSAHAGDAPTHTAPAGADPHAGHGTARSVADLTGPHDAEPDVRVTLTARHAAVTLPSGTVVDALTFDGTAPGPELRLRAGELVEVTLHNLDVAEGVTLHWHGLDVPNAEDGVAGVTQDAVAPGGSHVYRFRPEQVGTFWYHSHQDSAGTVPRGLFGALVVEAPDAPTDAVLLGHTFPGAGPVIDGPSHRSEVTRVRLVNTDSTTQTWTVAGAPFTVVAIDGTDVTGPTPLHGAALRIPAGGRIDVQLAGPATVGILDGPSVGFGTDPQPLTQAGPAFDPLTYGTPATPETGPYDRELLQVLDTERVTRRGVPSVVWTINGSLDPEPATVVDGELVRVTIRNDGTDPHPMHLHGHHVRVLSRDGVPATGSAWWTDSLGVEPGETYEVAFRAANPGIWMDHCHNLTHAAAGMVLHLAYEGVSTPFRHGGGAGNTPE